MPIYEYQCMGCKKVRERYYRSHEEAPKFDWMVCPAVGRIAKYKRIISSPNFHLKGPGWSRDNYEDRPWGNKEYHKAIKEDGYIPGSYVKTGKARFKKKE